VALLFVVPPAAAQVKKQPVKQMSKRPAADKKLHQLVLQVNTNDAATMNLTLNNATNVAQYYKDRGEKVAIEVVTFGPGLHMLRNDTSPVKARIETLALSTPEISYKACAIRSKICRSESKDIPIIPRHKSWRPALCGSWSCRSKAGPTLGRDSVSFRSPRPAASSQREWRTKRASAASG